MIQRWRRGWPHAALKPYGLSGPDAFPKVVSGRKRWNDDTKELDAWKTAF